MIKISHELDMVSNEIQKLKKHIKTSSFIQKYKLQSRLQEAQKLSDQLSRLGQDRLMINKELESAQTKLLALLDQHIEAERNKVYLKQNPVQVRQQAFFHLSELLMERSSILSNRFIEEERFPKDLPRLANTKLELREQLLAMEDLESKLLREIDHLKSELRLNQRQKFLQRELVQLFEEEAFFSEQGFISFGTPKSAVKKDEVDGALALTKNDAEESTQPVDGAMTTQPTPASVEPNPTLDKAATPALNAKDDSFSKTVDMGDNTSLLESNVDAPQNNEFSAPQREWTRDEVKTEKRAKTNIDAVSLDDQIHFLDRQLTQIKHLLGEVKKSRKDIEIILDRQ